MRTTTTRTTRTTTNVWALAAAVVLVAAVAGCGGDGGSNGPAAKAIKQQIDDLDKGRYTRAWQALHPAQQAFIPERLYVRCAEQTYGSLDVSNVKVTKVAKRAATVPGTHTRAPAEVLTVEYTVSQGGQEQSTDDTFTEFLVTGRYRLGTTGAEAYKDGECPSGSPPPEG